MIPEEIIKSIILQFPAIGVLLVALFVLYRDTKAERESAAASREKQLEQLILLNGYIHEIADRLNVDLPSDKSILADWSEP